MKMNQDNNFYEREYNLTKEIMGVEDFRESVNFYIGIVSTNGNFRDVCQKKVALLSLLEESVVATYKAYTGKELTYQQILQEYLPVIARVKANTAVHDYSNEGLKYN